MRILCKRVSNVYACVRSIYVYANVCTTKDLKKEEGKGQGYRLRSCRPYTVLAFFSSSSTLSKQRCRARAKPRKRSIYREDQSFFAFFFFVCLGLHTRKTRVTRHSATARKGHFNRSEQRKRDSKRGEGAVDGR